MILVTGASGLVGGNLVRALLADGLPVRAMFHQDHRALDGLPVEQVQGDIRDPAALARALVGVDLVYSLAASISLEMDSWPEVESVNVQGTRALVEACMQAGVWRLVYFSSIHALRQEPLDTPIDERRALADGPDFPPYDRSKALADREVQVAAARGLDVVTVIPTAMLGPNDFKPSYLGRAVRMMARGQVPALVTGGFNWVDVRDVVAGAMRAAQVAPPGARYLLAGHWHTIREVAQRVAALSGRPALRFIIPLAVAWAFAPLMGPLSHFNGGQPIYTRVSLRALRSNHHIDDSKARRELGYQSRPFEETVADTVRWFEQYATRPEGSR